MKFTTALLFALLLMSAVRFAVAEELRLSASEIFARASIDRLKLANDAKTIEFVHGKLFETDGLAAGYSYKPNEEALGEGVVVEKTMQIRILALKKPRGAKPTNLQATRAYLLVGHTGKSLSAEINGQPVALGEPAKAGNYWKRFEIPVSVVKNGTNVIKLSGDGKIWFARNDDMPVKLPWDPMLLGAQSSQKITVGSRSTKLGKNNDIEGEYYIRLYLEGIANNPSLSLILPLMDGANLTGKQVVSPQANIKRIHVQLDGDWSGLGSPTISVAGRWTSDVEEPFYSLDEGPEATLKAASSLPLPRHFSVHVGLPQDDANHRSRLRSITIRTETETPSDWGKKLTLVAKHNPDLPISLSDFRFESLDHPRLKQLREQYQLDEIVKGCKTDLQRMEKLAAWSSQLWTKGHLSEAYPKWDALEILKKHADGTPIGGFCQQYNIVFLQACESLGMPGRCVSIGAGDHGLKIRSGHEVVEIWSNEHNKWIYVDGQAAWYFVDKETREPLSLLELRERQVAHFQKQPLRAAEVVVLAKSPYEWKGFGEFPAFAELRMIPHTQFLDGKLIMPLNQGMRGWFWTGHHVWTDDKYPASILYPQRITREQDWNFPINQTQLWLEQKEKPGEVSVQLTHNMPSFDHFVVQQDEGADQAIKGNDFTWSLQPGNNRLQARAVNKLGLAGPPSWIKVSYSP